MHHLDVGEVELGSGCRHPVQPAALRIDHDEGRCSIGDGQGKAWQPRARSKVGPVLRWPRSSNGRQAEGVVQVPLPEPLLLPWAQEPEPDCIGVCPLQDFSIPRGQDRTRMRRVAARRMFHVKHYVGRMTTRR